MRRIKSLLSIVICCILVLGFMLATNNVFAGVSMERKIIVFNNTANNVQIEFVLKKHGAVKLKEISSINGVVVNVPKNNKIKDEQEILYIENDYVLSIEGKPLKEPKATPNPSASPTPVQNEVIPWGIEWMGAPEQWNSNTGDAVRVAIIDTGIDLNHPDLQANIKGGFNALSKKKAPNDDNGHGTHIAGTVAAIRNGIGVIGMLPNADIYAVKVLDSTGNGYVSDVIEGVDWCIKNNMEILNMSFGMQNNSQALHDIVIKASQAGIKMLAAAGNNNGGTSEYPAAYPEVISVGAIDQNGNIATFSAIENVDIYAPGVDIYSTMNNDGYTEMDGTSMATPHAIGYIISRSIQ